MEDTCSPLDSFGNQAECRGAQEELVYRARQGDVSSFEKLYRLHIGHVYALCLRLSGEVHSAEECTQEAFIHAWQSMGRFRGEAAFGSWLYRIAVNTVLARYRAELRRSLSFAPADTDEAERVPSSDAPLELALDLDRTIRELPLGARVVFVLHDIEGYGHPEIASMTHLAVGTSKAHLHRARRILRRRLVP